MLKRITTLGWLMIAMIVFLVLTGMNHLTHDKPKQAANQFERETEVHPKEKIPSQYPDIHILLETKETDAYHLSIETPVTKSDVINTELKDWIERQKDHFIEKSDQEEDSTLHIGVTITQITDSYYQIQFKTEKANEGTQTEMFNVDIENDRILTPGDVLDMDDSTLHTILQQAKENKGDSNIPDDRLEEMVNDPDTWNWGINSDVLTLYPDVADDSGNTITTSVDIPLDSLYLHAADDIVDIIDMPEEQVQDMEKAVQAEKERIEREKKKKEEEQAAKEKAKQEAKNNKAADKNEKYVALTFDDGPSSEVTPRVLDTLAKHGAVATFFMLGTEVEAHPETAKQVANAGHEIGNHTKNHTDLTTLSPEGIQSEINDTSNTIEQATGTRPYLVRAPYGAYNDSVIQTIAANGDALALWSVDSKDWQSRNANAVYNEVLQNVTSGSIVLMHDIHPTTADALDDLLTSLEERGYQFITVSQLLERQGSDGSGPFYGYTKK
ncbi:MAG TPA: polysaccharide deacetylase family protein [Virgibacillus sp.]|nr:polysaccharide deacetylase family protein [Virgibacillus sp.]